MKTVLITGGCEGIGLALARCFARDGYRIILNARDERKLQRAKDNLEKEYKTEVMTIPCDLSKRNGASHLFSMVGDLPIDVLVNNAGCGYTGVAWKQDAVQSEEMLELNDTAVMILSNLMVKKMVKRQNGVILNVASTGAFQPGPFIAAYYASKSFVLSYTRALHEEVKKDHVRVYCLCPGPVKTDFYHKSGVSTPKITMSSEKCARIAYHHLHQKSCVIIPGFANRFMLVVPSSIRMKAAGWMKKRVLKKEGKDVTAG